MQLLPIAVGISMGILIISWSITSAVLNITKEKLHNESRIYLEALSDSIDSSFIIVDNMVDLMAGSPWINPALNNETNTEFIARANSTLDRYSESLQDSTCYLLNADGTTIASSNRNNKDSFLGKNYSFRPYFRTAVKTGKGFYFALGVTSMKRGYYSSHVVKDAHGKIAGVAVIKQTIDFIEENFKNKKFLFLVDNKGIIFISSQEKYQYNPFWPLKQEERSTLEQSNQFGTIGNKSLIKQSPGNKTTIPFEGTQVILTTAPIRKPGWNLISLTPATDIESYSYISIILTLIAIAASGFGIMVFNNYRTQQWMNKIYLSEQRFKKIFDCVPGILIIIEKEGFVISAVNNYTLLSLGYTMEELQNASLNLLFKKQIQVSDFLTETGKVKKVNQFKLIYNNKEQGIESIVSSTDIVYENKECILLFANDISKLLKAEQALVENEELYREMFNTLPQIIFEADLNGSLIYVNEHGLKYFGYENTPVTKIEIMELLAPDSHSAVSDHIEQLTSSRHPINREYKFIKKDGTTFTGLTLTTPVIRNDNVIGFRGFIHDISRQKEQEEEKNRINKLESVGILAGGLAHDFNNILTSINNGVNFFELQFKDQEEIGKLIDELKTAINRGKDITQQLLTFSKGGAPVKKTSTIQELIKTTADFVLSGSKCKCEYNMDMDLWPVEIDRGQISQVIQNLIINGSHAMPKGGIFHVVASNILINASSEVNLKPGEYIKIEITDEGTGIPEEIRQKIFDPFFSTKSEGNGLGLATVHTIIQKHQGLITVKSILGKSTTFTILLPASKGARPVIKKRKKPAPLKKGTGKILLMDDDPLVLKTCQRIISFLGYEVTSVKNGDLAIEKYKSLMGTPSAFDVLITDLTVQGGKGGIETVEELQVIDPNLKAIVSSGYSNDPVMANYEDYGFIGVIRKPYKLDELSYTLNKVMGGEE